MHVVLPGSEAFSDLSVNACIAFGGIVIMAYFLGKRVAMSGARYVFIRMTIMLIFVKMFIGVGLVVYHVRIVLPENKLFIIPFLIIYLIFTIFEIYVLEKLGRIQPGQKAQ
ncbi:MAG: hypothetical protein DRI69_02585 [Bacteroidetes bacterium]|nr:MAG: hypothetical protein DRI69_02585 [Bacteroidota bacterium]